METQVLRKIDTPEGSRLGFATGIHPRRFRSIDTVKLKQAHGFIVHSDGTTEPWIIEKMIEADEQIIALGPWIAHKGFIDLKDIHYSLLSLLIIAARALGKAGFPLGGYFRQAFIRLESASLLVLPPLLCTLARTGMSQDHLSREWDLWCHPDLQGEEAWSFSLAVLCYLHLTGEDPFGNEEEEKRRERIRLGLISPLTLKAAGVKESATKLICNALSAGGSTRPGFDEWDNLIKHWRKEGIVQHIAPEELQNIRVMEAHQRSKLEKRLRMRRLMRHSGVKFAAIGIAVIVLAVFLSSPVKRMLEDPVTMGMDAYQVAQTYYKAFNELDGRVMEDCLARKIGRSDVEYVETVFVTQKIREGYEGIQNFPTASEWLSAGRPDLPEGVWPWGITDLILTSLPDGRIEARYVFWGMNKEISPEDPDYTGVQHRDILSFTQGRRSLEISSIERTMAE